MDASLSSQCAETETIGRSAIAPIIKWKEKEERPFGTEVSASSPATWYYWLYWKTIFIEDGVLY